jgi:hypothetical protein
VYAAVHACHVRQNGRNVMAHRSREDGRVDMKLGIYGRIYLVRP